MKPSVYALRDAILYWAGRPDATEEKILRTAERLASEAELTRSRAASRSPASGTSVAPQGQTNLSLQAQGATELPVEGARRSSRAPSTSP